MACWKAGFDPEQRFDFVRQPWVSALQRASVAISRAPWLSGKLIKTGLSVRRETGKE